MRLTDLSTHDQLLRQDLAGDAELREEWDDRALARAVAHQVIAFRALHALSQSAFGRRIDMSQPQVARLESGEHTPTLGTLYRVSDALNVEFVIDVVPAGRKPRLVTNRAKEQMLVSNWRLFVAAG